MKIDHERIGRTVRETFGSRTAKFFAFMLAASLILQPGRVSALDLNPVKVLDNIVKEGERAKEKSRDVVETVARNPGKAIEKVANEVNDAVSNTATDVSRTVQQVGGDTITTIQKNNNDTVKVLQTTAGDTVTTFQKAGSDSVTTFQKGVKDVTATYVKGWRDTAEETKRSFQETVDAGQAVVRYTQRQIESQRDALNNAQKRVREGKVVDAMWGASVEPLQSTEKNFAKATQESAVINTAAQTAAASYGGPAGAAAYAAWSTYRATGDANLALRAGVLSAITSQTGGTVASMPSGTAGQLLKKAAVAGAIGGLSVAAAGGDEHAVQEAFLKSGGTVLIQGGSEKLGAYSPKTRDAIQAVQCISAKDVDCLSNTTYVLDAKGKILYDKNGKPRIDPQKLNPAHSIGEWSGIGPNSAEGKRTALITDISKIPNMQAIPILHNQWVVTSTMGKNKTLQHNVPSVVVTYVGPQPPFHQEVQYGRSKLSPATAAPSQKATSRGSSYVCSVNGSKRTVTLTFSSPDSCEAVYKKENASQIIWKSEHDPNSCAPHVDAFVRHLRGLKIDCSAH